MTRDEALSGFLTAVETAYAGIDHPAAGHLRQRLPGARPELSDLEPSQDAPAYRFLNTALSADDGLDLAQAASQLSPHLVWQESTRPGMPASFKGRSAFTVIAGPDGLLPVEHYRLGLFLQAPETYYPAHAHDAEELYLVLSGRAVWQAGEERFEASPGRFVHHPSTMVHIMETGPAPLLALWAWLGDFDGRFWYP